MRQWRLIYDQPTHGALNMALDDTILSGMVAPDALPTLRLYGWTPPCLSLGYGQRAREADTDRLAARGWEIVRRPTGGRAILHADELTYSLAFPFDHPLAQQTIVESYQQISAAISAGLKRLGAQPQANRAQTIEVNPVCFATPAHYEITIDGRKLVGSAQMRRKQGILQHGTLPLSGDITRVCDALVYADEAARLAAKADLRAHALTLEDALGVVVDWQSAAHALVEGFIEVFGVTFMPGEFTPSELAQADRLAAEVYGSASWTFRR